MGTKCSHSYYGYCHERNHPNLDKSPDKTHEIDYTQSSISHLRKKSEEKVMPSAKLAFNELLQDNPSPVTAKKRKHIKEERMKIAKGEILSLYILMSNGVEYHVEIGDGEKIVEIIRILINQHFVRFPDDRNQNKIIFKNVFLSSQKTLRECGVRNEDKLYVCLTNRINIFLEISDLEINSPTLNFFETRKSLRDSFLGQIISPLDNVHTIKKRIELRDCFEVDDQALFLRGRELMDDEIASSHFVNKYTKLVFN